MLQSITARPTNLLFRPRLKSLTPSKRRPFYGFMFTGGMTATFGGPKINPKAQIINTEGQPIPGLYGAGNAVGGIFYDNYLDGSQLTAAVIWGRIAAREALARAKAMRG